jgi:hypothetical protein
MGFFSNFFGGDSRRDIRDGQAQANQMLTQGRDEAQGRYDTGYEESKGYIDPYIESGQRGSEFYDDLLGLNGDDARDAAQGILESDQGFQGQLGESQNAMLRHMNARGNSNSGAGALAGARVARQGYTQQLGAYGNRAAQGYQAAGAGANLATGYANNSAQLQYGTAQQKAANQISSSNAIGQTRNTGMNNMLGIAGLGLKGYAAANSGNREPILKQGA